MQRAIIIILRSFCRNKYFHGFYALNGTINVNKEPLFLRMWLIVAYTTITKKVSRFVQYGMMASLPKKTQCRFWCMSKRSLFLTLIIGGKFLQLWFTASSVCSRDHDDLTFIYLTLPHSFFLPLLFKVSRVTYLIHLLSASPNTYLTFPRDKEQERKSHSNENGQWRALSQRLKKQDKKTLVGNFL